MNIIGDLWIILVFILVICKLYLNIILNDRKFIVYIQIYMYIFDMKEITYSRFIIIIFILYAYL